MGIELFIFDWSGTISDDRRSAYEAYNKLLIENGHPGMTFEEWLPQTKPDITELLESQGIKLNRSIASLLYKRYFDDAIENGITPVIYPDVKEALEFLKNKKKQLAILSSRPLDNLLKEAQEYKISEYFDFIIGSARDKVNGIKKIVNGLKSVPEKTLYIGDTVYDIRAAKEAGIKAAGISGSDGNQRGYHSKERLLSESPDFMLETLKELIDEKLL